MTVRVLIVEDNPINRELVDYLLRAHGFETFKAMDGAIGLDVARRERPHLILSDIQMPGMDGIEFARELKRDPALRHTPLVALTALAMVGDRDRILAEGFDGYIAKPVDPQTFLETVNGFLEPSLRQEAAAPPRATPVAAPIVAGSALILVLDDMPFNLALKRDLLEPHGFEVQTASTVAQAWELAQARPPDLIISDVGLQGGHGFEFIRRVKADPRLGEIPFIFLSATHWADAAKAEGLRLGALRYLCRPLEPTVLLAEILACLPSPRPAR
jgi:two-component system cell cycle response regulator